MIEVLNQVEKELNKLLNEPEQWSTLDINYEKPHVERVWRQWEKFRINLHHIHPCSLNEVFFHPHPWPSAVKIISGKYEMAVGYGAGIDEPPICSKMILASDSTYEMIDRDSWHYVRPLNVRALSLMITGTPWKREMPKSDKINLSILSEKRKIEIIRNFQNWYPLEMYGE